METYSNNKLPEAVLGLIFQDIGNLESFLNCRLVCKYWKNAFDNSMIMKEPLWSKIIGSYYIYWFI